MVHTFSRMSIWVSGAAISIAMFGIVAPAHSAAIVGTLNFNGDLVATSTSFDLLPKDGPTGDFTVQQNGNTGSFTVLNGTPGKVKDLDIGSQPVDTPLNFSSFLTFSTAPNVSFTLTKLLGGTSGQAGCTASPADPGQACTPFAGSPINFFNTSKTSSLASFSVLGFFTDSSDGSTSQAVGQFSANFNLQNYQQLLATLSSDGRIPTPYTGVFTAVPEPDMLPSVLGLGTVVAGAVALRRRVIAVK